MCTPRLSGKVAIITGGTSGIGEQAVRLFAENGASVVAVGTRDDAGHQIVASIGSDKVCYYRCDVRDDKQVEEMVNFTIQKYGSVDILFSNAGTVGPMTGFLKFDLEGFQDTMVVNVLGVALTIKHVGRVMVERKIRGSIICSGSLAATVAGVSPLAYTASKHALLGMVKSASGELGVHGIKVNCVSTTGVATPLVCNAFKLSPSQVEQAAQSFSCLKGKIQKPMDVAKAALFLASDDSSCISGHNLVIDGGFTVVMGNPRAVWE